MYTVPRACCHAQRVSLCSPATVAPALRGQAYGTSSCAQHQHADCSVGSCAVASELNALSWFRTCRVTCTTTRLEIHCARLGRYLRAVPGLRFSSGSKSCNTVTGFVLENSVHKIADVRGSNIRCDMPGTPCPRSALEHTLRPHLRWTSRQPVARCAAPASVIGYIAPTSVPC